MTYGELTNGQDLVRVPRFIDVPQIRVVLLDRKDLPSAGAGEIGIVALAPAVGNAIFAASSIRVTTLSMAPRKPAPGLPAPSFSSRWASESSNPHW